MEPKISIIIPMYNREKYIEECIRSVQMQTYRNLEILLIDDGSTDQTVELCRTMADSDRRIILYQEAHGGVSAARNKGLAAATGKYIFFVDSDDVIQPPLLETLVKAMEHSGAPIAGTRRYNVTEEYWHNVPIELQKETGPGQTEYLDHTETVRRVFTEKTPLGIIGGVMMRKDWIGETRFRTDLYIGEDFYFIYENLIKGASAIFLKQIWYYGRLHESNISWDFRLSGFRNRLHRRELVWKSEEALGRQAYANTQKVQVFNHFLDFLRRGKMSRDEERQMRQIMRQYRKTLFPALTRKMKLVYYVSVYFPSLYCAMLRLKKKGKQAGE